MLDTYDPNDENVFVIQFTKNFMWDLSHTGNPMMYMRYGEPRSRIAGFPSDQFLRNLQRIFSGITQAQAERLCDLARAVSVQAHGAMLVVSSAAGAEAARLSNQATGIQPVALDNAMIPRATSIDGAVLVDLDGICHAIGVILDGAAHRRCASSRGARYNSGVRYAHGRKDCVVIVKSEDGMVDLFPVLHPQISRAELNSHLSRFRALVAEKSEDLVQLTQIADWLADHRFYLSAVQCEEVNGLRNEAAKYMSSEAFRVPKDELQPDPEMDDSFLLP